MRPLRVEVSGFLSYAEPTALDLRELPAAVIVGPNGAGKTSLVEALLWSLFGKGRGRSPDDFVSAGRTECRVTFDFTLEGETYRVVRERSLHSGGKSYLGLFGSVDGEWQPVGGDSIAETQAAIERLLGMDADTWLSASFIGQNRADQFTRLTAAGRKQLLAEILDLGLYERLHDAAKRRAATFACEHLGWQRRQEALEDQLAKEPEAVARAEDAVKLREEAHRRVADVEQSLDAALGDLDTAKRHAVQVEGLRQRLIDMQRSRDHQLQRLDREITAATREIERKGEERRSVGELVARLRASRDLVPVLSSELDSKAKEVIALEAAAEEAKATVARVEAQAAATGQRGAAAAERAADARTSIEVLSRSSEPVCPTCGQALSAEHRDRCIADLGAEAERWAGLANDASAETEKALDSAKSHHLKATENLHRARVLRQEIDRTREAIERAKAATEQLEREEERLSHSQDQVIRLHEALRSLKDEREVASRPSEEEAALAKELDSSERILIEVNDLSNRVAELRRGIDEARRLYTAKAEDAAKAEEAVATFASVRTELAQVNARLSAAIEERYAYEWLTGAFGRDGIPSLILENAIPEIEDEANHLLERLTEGRFTVRLSALKATKTAGIRETLDITVADAMTEHPLEALSGGERQCVDLALRVSLSRLLARRAGRRIETLILDEAFTALDSGHRQRTIEVLRELTEEFPVVLFVTHLQELADAFPARIVVARDGDSSRVEVAARGTGLSPCHLTNVRSGMSGYSAFGPTYCRRSTSRRYSSASLPRESRT